MATTMLIAASDRAGGARPPLEAPIASGKARGRFRGFEKIDAPSRTKPSARHRSGRIGSPGGATAHANARKTSAKLSESDVSQNAYKGAIDAARKKKLNKSAARCRDPCRSQKNPAV